MVKDWANEDDTKLLVRRGKGKDSVRRRRERKLFGKRLFLSRVESPNGFLISFVVVVVAVVVAFVRARMHAA